MLRSTLSVLLLSLSALALGACTKEDTSSSDKSDKSGDDDDDSTSSSKKKSTDKTEPKGDDDDDDSEASVGPNCTAYLDCCDQLAEDQPSVAKSCDATRKAINDAVDNGASVDSYEAACKQAVSSWKSAGYCK